MRTVREYLESIRERQGDCAAIPREAFAVGDALALYETIERLRAERDALAKAARHAAYVLRQAAANEADQENRSIYQGAADELTAALGE